MSHLELFNDSYERAIGSNPHFFDTFYDLFIAKSASFAEKFTHVSMERQKLMLRDAINFLMSYSINHQATDYLEQLAIKHQEDIRVSTEDYELWLDALLETLAIHDPHYSDDVAASWIQTLTPGITFMQTYRRTTDQDIRNSY